LTHDELCNTFPPTEDRINLVDVCRQIMRIVARLETQSYTDSIERRTEVVVHPDPADPASASDTPQGWDALYIKRLALAVFSLTGAGRFSLSKPGRRKPNATSIETP